MDSISMTVNQPRFRGEAVRWRREDRGWSLGDLAERTKVTKERIRQVERGDEPGRNLREKLGEVFGIDWRRFYDDTDTDRRRKRDA